MPDPIPLSDPVLDNLRELLKWQLGEEAVVTFDECLEIARRLPYSTDEVPLGLYRHYKGGFYQVLGVAQHHETREPYVIYASLGHHTLNIRPLKGHDGEFSSEDGFLDILFSGEPRFARIEK